MVVSFALAVADHNDGHIGQFSHGNGRVNVVAVVVLDQDIGSNATLDTGDGVHGIKRDDMGAAAAAGHGLAGE